MRLPFLNQAIQGDDPYYLFGARHALIDPAHPSHARYVFQGELVDMRGHPHPPLDSWILAGLLVVFGDVREIPFRAVYAIFSLAAAAAMWFLARRWSPHPLWASLLFVVTPAFLISGNTLETDMPFLAFWMTGFALFVSGRLGLAAASLALAALMSYQAIVATPILWVYCWLHARRSRAAWAVALTPVLVVGGYQLYERLTSGALPARVLAGYFSTYKLQSLMNKLNNAAGLTVHAGWLVFPVAAAAAFRRRWYVGVIAGLAVLAVDPNPLFWMSFGVGALVIASCFRKNDFLAAWVLLFFAAALVLFFAGAARYLLPMSAPVILLASQRLSRRWLAGAFAANLVLGLVLTTANYQHWNGYRDFAATMPDPGARRVWINGEWGLRYYLEKKGAHPLTLDEILMPGDWIVSSELGFPIPVKAPLELVSEYQIQPSVPFRVMGLGARSGYATVTFGLRPFDVVTEPADRIRIHQVKPRKVTLSWLPMNAPEAAEQIVAGLYDVEGSNRWMAQRALILVKPPPEPSPVTVQFYVPPESKATVLVVHVDDEEVYRQAMPGPGIHTIETRPAKGSALWLDVDQTFSTGADARKLSIVLMGAGYRQPQALPGQ